MADDDFPDPQALIRLVRQTLSSSERRKKYRRIDFMDTAFWYPSQLAFFAAGSSGLHQRFIYGGNQSGKTLSCGAEVSWHLTGAYPDWWAGKRFNKPIRVWAVGESTMLVRDTLQRKLCGDDEFGTGLLPLEAFGRKPLMIPGGTGAADTLFIQHSTDGVIDGTSTLSFKSYEQRREKLQSESLDLVWCDEKPDEQIYSELLARTSATDGHLLVSYTPVGPGGGLGVTYKFLSEPSSDRAVFRIRGEEVRHISAERREVLSGEYDDAERETRLEGTPQLGTGPVFPLELLPTMVKSFNPDSDIPFYARWCVGIDFGFGHPFAAALIAWAPDTGQIWVVDSFRMERSSALYHVQRIHSMTRGLRVPVAWPHDGNQHDKGSGLPLSLQYKTFGANMMADHAVNHGTKMNSVDPALEEMREMMFGGKLTIAGHNHELLDEMRNYHRDEDYKIVKQRDDLISALRYAIMMRRQGKPLTECDGIGYGNMPYAMRRPERSRGEQYARGSANHPDGDGDAFTGQ
jgi:phage terminase large subunit-like protein